MIFQFAAAVKEFGAVTHLSFSTVAPYNYTVTSGSKVRPVRKLSVKSVTFKKFKLFHWSLRGLAFLTLNR